MWIVVPRRLFNSTGGEPPAAIGPFPDALAADEYRQTQFANPNSFLVREVVTPIDRRLDADPGLSSRVFNEDAAREAMNASRALHRLAQHLTQHSSRSGEDHTGAT